MILNGVIAHILHFSPNSIALLTDYVTVVEARLTISVTYCLWVPVFHFRPKLMYPAARSLCDSWASYSEFDVGWVHLRVGLKGNLVKDNFKFYWLIPAIAQAIIFYSFQFLQRVRMACHAQRCTTVLARAILPVCPSVTLRYCVQMNEDTILRFSASGRIIPLVSGKVKFIRIFEGDHPQRRH